MSKSRPKILFIGPTPPPYSGPELSMQQFLESKSLNESFEISFLKTNFRTDNTKKGKFGLSMVTQFFVFFFKLLKQLVLDRPKCVYYPVTPTQIGWLGRDVWTILLSKLFGAKIIIHLRGSHFKLNFNEFSATAKKLIAFSLKHVDKAIVQAKYLKNQFSPFISEEKVAVLYQAMDINEFKYDENYPIEKGKILVIGHMTKAKGFTDILKVIPEVCKVFPEAKFYFAGNMRKGERGVFYNQVTGEKIIYEDPFVEEKRILDSAFKNNYVNLGIIKGEDKLRHLKSSEIFLTASYSEGFSRSLLEAMAVGKPLAYTPVGAHREVLKDGINGYVFNPGDINEMQNVLTNMLANPDQLKNMGLENREYVVNDFSVEKIVDDFKNIINSTIPK